MNHIKRSASKEQKKMLQNCKISEERRGPSQGLGYGVKMGELTEAEEEVSVDIGQGEGLISLSIINKKKVAKKFDD